VPQSIAPEVLLKMQQIYDLCLKNVNFNDGYGYHNYVSGIKIIEDLLLLDAGFLNIALDPLLVAVMKNKSATMLASKNAVVG
jgi:hypothetical protein